MTTCPWSSPSHAALAQAGIAPVAERRLTLTARLLAKARALPEDDPLRRVAEANVRPRLSTVSSWRTVGQEVWRATGVTSPIEPLLLLPAQPWDPVPPVSFRLDIGAALPPPAPSIERQRDAASLHLASLPQQVPGYGRTGQLLTEWRAAEPGCSLSDLTEIMTRSELRPAD